MFVNLKHIKFMNMVINTPINNFVLEADSGFKNVMISKVQILRARKRLTLVSSGVQDDGLVSQ